MDEYPLYSNVNKPSEMALRVVEALPIATHDLDAALIALKAAMVPVGCV